MELKCINVRVQHYTPSPLTHPRRHWRDLVQRVSDFMSNDNAFFLNTFYIVTVLEMSLLSDVHNSCDDVLICGDSDVHEEDSTDQTITFFSRHIFVYLNKSTKREQNEMNLREHRNKNTAHYRSQYYLTASVADKKCAVIVCSHMPFHFKCCVRGEITMLIYIWRLFTEEFQMNPIHVLPHIRFSATDICTFVTLLRLIFRLQVHPFDMFS